ncbi:MAG TPA: IS630 family transposase [Deferrisomatales bacterium]|nr:IS630 family transposase [Deferrisomatales bacterium]
MSQLDGRKLDHKTREAIRIRAVQRVEAGESPEVVVKALGFSRARIYEWLARYQEGGIEALRFKGIPGKKPKLSGADLRKLARIITEKDPRQLKFEFALWTRAMVRKLIMDEFGVILSESQVGRLLHTMGMSPQKPLHRAWQRDPERVQHWLDEEFPAIQKLAKKQKTQIFFGDEAGIRSDYHRGTTWAPKGKTPVVETTGARFSVNMISAISAKGQMRFMTVEGTVTAIRFVQFLERLMDGQERPVFLIVDGHPVHRAKKVKEFVTNTGGKLRLFRLPSYSPDLNPDELVWNHVKRHRVGRMSVARPDDLKKRVLSALRSLQKSPAKIRGFFQAPSVRYATA